MAETEQDKSVDRTRWLQIIDANYEIASYHHLKVGKKMFLGSRDNRCCRFCGQFAPAVTFKMKAHAFPEAIGNKSLFNFYECDGCNQLFGAGIEDHFAKFTAPLRCLSQVSGKKGVPTVSREGDGWKIALGTDRMLIEHSIGKEIVDIDEKQGLMTLTVELQTYIPSAVFKTYVKMALSMMPEAEVPNFKHALHWIRKPVDDPQLLFRPLILLQTMVPGPRPFPGVSAFLLRRRREGLEVPYMAFVVAFGNYTHQIFLPSGRDVHLHEKPLQLPRFPTPYDVWPWSYGEPSYGAVDLSGIAPIAGERRQVIMHFDHLSVVS